MPQSFILIGFSVCILILSQAAPLVRWAEAAPDVVGFWRMAMSVPLLAFAWRLQKDRQKLFSYSRPIWLKLGLCSIFLFFHWRLWFMAVERTSIANATVCFALTPLLTAVGSLIFFKEKISTRLWLAISLGMVGVFSLVAGKVETGAHAGDLLGLLSTACFSGYILSGKSLRTKMSNLNFTLSAYLLVGIYFAIALSLGEHTFLHHSSKTWFFLFSLTLGPTLFGHAVFTYCLNYLDVNFMTCATLFEPIFAAWTAATFFHEPLTVSTLVAFALISVGVLMVYQPNIKSLLT